MFPMEEEREGSTLSLGNRASKALDCERVRTTVGGDSPEFGEEERPPPRPRWDMSTWAQPWSNYARLSRPERLRSD